METAAHAASPALSTLFRIHEFTQKKLFSSLRLYFTLELRKKKTLFRNPICFGLLSGLLLVIVYYISYIISYYVL